jgi:hypothetical protein
VHLIGPANGQHGRMYRGDAGDQHERSERATQDGLAGRPRTQCPKATWPRDPCGSWPEAPAELERPTGARNRWAGGRPREQHDNGRGPHNTHGCNEAGWKGYEQERWYLVQHAERAECDGQHHAPLFDSPHTVG